MKIYTRAGDEGYTRLGTGDPVHKSDARVEAYGTIDELSSFIGLALSHLPEGEKLALELQWVQRTLFQVGSLLAFPGKDVPPGVGAVDGQAVAHLENAVDELQDELPPLSAFILPGGTKAAALLHCARTICRRAERQCAAIDPREYPLGGSIMPFLNRLSDYLFCAARWVNVNAGRTETFAN